MTITIKGTRTIGLKLEDMEVRPGTTVIQVLTDSGRFNTPGELMQCRVYEENDKHELAILDKHTSITSDTNLFIISPILGAAPVSAPWMSFRDFWKAAAADLWKNIGFGWPVFIVIAAFAFSSAYLMLLLEPTEVRDYCTSLYFTWVTMTTIGYGDLSPKSDWGRLLASIDGLVGIVLIGVVVWLVTQSLTQDKVA